MKRNLLLILMTLLPMVAGAYDAEIDGIYYNFSENEAEVTYKDRNYNSYSGAVVIPESVTYSSNTYLVTAIGMNAFRDCTELTSVTIPEKVTNIGNNAFYKCSSLTDVDFRGDSVHFGIGVFMGCTSLRTLDLPAGDEVDAHRLLSGCTSLESLTIPEGYKSFGNSFLGGGTSLRYLSLPTTMEKLYLSDQIISGLTTLYITPTLLRTWVSGWNYFWRGTCPNLKDLYLRASSIQDICENGVLKGYAGGLTTAHAHLLINGEEIKDLQIPMGVDSLAEAAFSYMGFETVNIPSSLTSLSKGAFLQCWNLKEVVVPGSVKIIGEGAFSRCEKLEKATLEEGVEVMEAWTFDKTPLKEVSLPSSLREIGRRDFENCSNLTSVTIPDGVTTIGSSAFYGCSSLTDVYCYIDFVLYTNDPFYNIPYESATLHVPVESLNQYKTTSPWSRFGSIVPLEGTGDCANIDGIYYTLSENTAKVISGEIAYAGEVIIPESVTYNGNTYTVKSIGAYAFYKSSDLTSVSIPNTVIRIGGSAFFRCVNLTSITIPNSVTYIGPEAFFQCDGLNSITIPNSVTAIGDNTFNQCYGLISATIGNSVTSIGNKAFYLCHNLTSLTIPNSVISIGNDAFYGCSGLTSIKVETGNVNYDSRNGCNAIIETASNTLIIGCQNTIIPNSVTYIGNGAFYSCAGLTSVTIPDGVTNIGVLAFQNCSGLTSLTISNSVTSIGSSAFRGCSGLTTIKVEIGNANYDSRNDCNAIIETASNTLITGCQNTIIPNSVTEISDYAFCGCNGLTSITIPNSVTYIRNAAFASCGSLSDVYCYADNVPSIIETVFVNTPIESATLHVPASAIEQYMTAYSWSKFGNIVPLTDDEVDGIEGPTPNLSRNGGEVIDLNGRKVLQPRNGIFIKNGKKVSTK